MAIPATLEPWRERGVPLEKRYRSWKQRIKAPYDKRDVERTPAPASSS